MKRLGTFALLLAVLLPGLAQGQEPGAGPQRFFRPAQLLRFGVFYYPEQSPKHEWKRDLDGIARLGFDFTHFGEFAWTELEPEEGRFVAQRRGRQRGETTWRGGLAHAVGPVRRNTPRAGPSGRAGVRSGGAKVGVGRPRRCGLIDEPPLYCLRSLRVAETPECSDEAFHEARRRMKTLQPGLHNAFMRRVPRAAH